MRMTYLATSILVAGLSLAGCTALPAQPGPDAALTSTTSVAGGHERGGGGGSASCTDRFDYSGDPRSNAEINTIGETSGACPPVESRRPAPTAAMPDDPNVSCTNRLDYGDDPRSNAEINSVGEVTGFCPVPKH